MKTRSVLLFDIIIHFMYIYIERCPHTGSRDFRARGGGRTILFHSTGGRTRITAADSESGVVFNMDYSAVSQVISNIGFPIFCVLAMFTLWNKEREDHKIESDKWVEAIHNNTLVMEKILERMESAK